MTALAAATSRVALIATVNPLLFHPTLMAKMAATADDVSDGRLGLNLITGATLREYEQMGVLPEDYDRRRYAYAAEWLGVLKRLWSEPSVTHQGEFFHLQDCVSEPKPVQKPHPFLVCAGASDEGLSFTAGVADYSFINGKDHAALRQISDRVKALAAENGRTIKTAASAMLMIADTRAEAEAQWAHLVDGADVEALTNSGNILVAQSRERAQAYGAERLAGKKINTGQLIMGSPQDVADGLTELVTEGGIDSFVTMFPDYLDGLKRFGRDVMPLLRRSLDVGPEGARMTHKAESVASQAPSVATV
jgi:pyrimidine oxygenase